MADLDLRWRWANAYDLRAAACLGPYVLRELIVPHKNMGHWRSLISGQDTEYVPTRSIEELVERRNRGASMFARLSRVTVTRTLQRLRRSGEIKIVGRAILVRDLAN